MAKRTGKVRKIVLAYSGGLDTSVILPWLKDRYACEVVAFAADVGQGADELDGIEAKALASGASRCIVADLRKEFAEEYCFRMLSAGAVYENVYLLGTSIARPLIAKAQVDCARKVRADAVAHGATGKGNDQVRFELTYKALAPHLKVIAPWRMWDIRSREEAIDYANAHKIDLGKITKQKIYSRDENLWHLSHEGGDLEDPWNRPKEDMFQRTKSPQEAPDRETEISVEFEKGFPVAVNGKRMAPLALVEELNRLGAENGIGRVDMVETRQVGMKSRGVYETPGGTILHAGIRELEQITLDADALHFKRMLAMRYSELVYSGKWYTPLRDSLEAFMEKISEYTSGTVRLVLYKGNVIVAGRTSPYSLYLQDLASFGSSSYDHADAAGFINLFGLATGVAAIVHRGIDKDTGQTPEIKGMAGFHEK